MQTLTIADIRIDRVLEQEGPIFGLDFLLPEAPADMFDANADWLMPRFADPASRNLILAFHSLLVRTPTRTILVMLHSLSTASSQCPACPEAGGAC